MYRLKTGTPAAPTGRGLLARRLGLALVFVGFLVGGAAHFAATEREMSIVPAYIPRARAGVLVTGALELLGAAGLLLPFTRRQAGVGLMLLTIAVTPANLYMLQHADWYGIPYWMLLLRLPLQVALIALIAWSTGALHSAWAKRRT